MHYIFNVYKFVIFKRFPTVKDSSVKHTGLLIEFFTSPNGMSRMLSDLSGLSRSRASSTAI